MDKLKFVTSLIRKTATVQPATYLNSKQVNNFATDKLKQKLKKNAYKH